MKITYIYHSSFLVECRSIYLLFDYFKGTLPLMNREKPLYVFASHRHGDHFSPAIFNLPELFPKARFILSDDIRKGRVPDEMMDRTVFMGPDMKREVGQIVVETIRSTDEGVAFLVSADDDTVYHAGDLNDWTWEGEPEEDNEKMSREYREYTDRLKGHDIDAAFLPLDGRLEQHYARGIEYFMRNVGAGIIFPMHCWSDYTVIHKFKEQYKDEPGIETVADITRQGQSFEVRNKNYKSLMLSSPGGA